MKVIAFNGSPHAEGTTDASVRIVAEELSRQEIKTEIVHVGGKQIRGCAGCYKCRELKRCVHDDIVNEMADRTAEADGLILASPVYYASIAGTMKCFLDRLFFSAGGRFASKVGASLVALRRSGGVAAFQQLNNYLFLARVIVTPSLYWDVIHGTDGREVRQDKEGVQILQTLGSNMAWLLKTVEEGKKARPFPSPPAERVRTNFVR